MRSREQYAGVPGSNCKATSIIRKLRVFRALSEEEMARINALEKTTLGFRRGDELIRQNGDYRDLYIVNSGWAAREKCVGRGRRQIVNFVLPGDFACFNACLFKRSAHTVRAITEVQAARVECRQVLDLMAQDPGLALAIHWANACEKSLLEERIASLGRRDAAERIAHLILELWYRLQAVGLANGREIHVPLTQALIGDATGLTQVYVNRTLKRLQREGAIIVRPGPKWRITIIDLRSLKKTAAFNKSYIHFSGRCRSECRAGIIYE